MRPGKPYVVATKNSLTEINLAEMSRLRFGITHCLVENSSLVRVFCVLKKQSFAETSLFSFDFS